MEYFIISALFGIIGSVYFFYGKKRKYPVTMYTGVALCVYPYAIDSIPWLIGIGIVLVAIPFFYKV